MTPGDLFDVDRYALMASAAYATDFSGEAIVVQNTKSDCYFVAVRQPEAETAQHERSFHYYAHRPGSEHDAYRQALQLMTMIALTR